MRFGFGRITTRCLLVAGLASLAAGDSAFSAVATPAAALPWAAPADIDQTVPPIRADIPCPLSEVLNGASEQVQELVANIHRFSARERIEHVEISGRGNRRPARKNSFNYVAQINQAASGSPSVEEYRTSTSVAQTPEMQMVDTGTAAFALIFHRFFLEDFAMSCEGLAVVESRAAWQLHFTQLANRNNLFHVYRVGSNVYPVKLKGRAWIAADNYEVLRLQTDLLERIGQIRLLREHSDIQYASVEFRKQNVRLWLPRMAELYMDYRGHRYQRRHNFSNFQLFTVESGEEIKGPKASRKK
jgi:hypothetical protein